MNFSTNIRLMVVGLLTTSVVLAGNPWKKKPYTEWTAEEVQALLTDSPWAKKVNSYNMGTRIVIDQEPSTASTVMVMDSRTGALRPKTVIVHRAPTEETIPVVVESHKFELLWLSALTVRQGIVRRRVLEGTLTAEAGERFLASGSEHYVLALAGPGIYSLSTVPEKEFRSASLKTRKGDGIIPLDRYFLGEGESGALAQVLFYFPRELNGEATLAPEETKVTFLLETQAGSIEAKFNLTKMVRGGTHDI